jgi:hypothetical protein
MPSVNALRRELTASIGTIALTRGVPVNGLVYALIHNEEYIRLNVGVPKLVGDKIQGMAFPSTYYLYGFQYGYKGSAEMLPDVKGCIQELGLKPDGLKRP